MKDVRHSLDRIAEEYHLNPEIADMHIEEIAQEYCTEWVLSSLKPLDRVLELGYGDGHVTQALIEKGCKVTVIEGSKLLIEKAKENLGDKVNLIETLFEEYAPHEPYDVVIASHVLEHVDSPTEILSKIRTWVKPGGNLFCIVPNRNSIHRQLAVMMGLQPQLDSLSARDHLVGHQRVYSLENLIEDLERSQFKVFDQKGFFLKFLPNSMMLKFSHELLRALNQISPTLPPNIMCNIGVAAKRL